MERHRTFGMLAYQPVPVGGVTLLQFENLLRRTYNADDDDDDDVVWEGRKTSRANRHRDHVLSVCVCVCVFRTYKPLIRGRLL